MSNGSGSFNLLDDVLNGGDINKKVGEYKPEYEKQVEEINAFLEWLGGNFNGKSLWRSKKNT